MTPLKAFHSVLNEHKNMYHGEILKKIDTALAIINKAITETSFTPRSVNPSFSTAFTCSFIKIWTDSNVRILVANTINSNSFNFGHHAQLLNLFHDLKSHALDLLIANPDRLLQIHNDLSANHLMYSNPSDKIKATFELIYDYEDFVSISNNAVWNGNEYCKRLGARSCPYCNRAYITRITGKASWKPQFDHFFPKCTYPALRLSLQNLIPVCSQCNYIKGSKDFPYPELNPFSFTAPQIEFYVPDPLIAINFSTKINPQLRLTDKNPLPHSYTRFYSELGIIDAYKSHIIDVNNLLEAKSALTNVNPLISQNRIILDWFKRSYYWSNVSLDSDRPILSHLLNDIAEQIQLVSSVH